MVYPGSADSYVKWTESGQQQWVNLKKKTWKTNGKKGTRNWAFPLKGYKKHYKGSFGEIFGAILNCLDKRYSEFSIKHFYK